MRVEQCVFDTRHGKVSPFAHDRVCLCKPVLAPPPALLRLFGGPRAGVALAHVGVGRVGHDASHRRTGLVAEVRHDRDFALHHGIEG